MIITVSGKIASGKSVAARHIAGEYGFEYLSPGKIMRDMAAEKDMDVNEFSKIAESTPKIDKEIDSRQKKITSQGDWVVDGRLSPHMLNADARIWLTAPIKERAKRIMGREARFTDMEAAIESISQREKSEQLRYKKYYGIDVEDQSIYDIILDTGILDIQEMKMEIIRRLDSKLKKSRLLSSLD